MKLKSRSRYGWTSTASSASLKTILYKDVLFIFTRGQVNLAFGFELARGVEDLALHRLDVAQSHRPDRFQLVAQQRPGAFRRGRENLFVQRGARRAERHDPFLAL